MLSQMVAGSARLSLYSEPVMSEARYRPLAEG
jgi:hypothetical protein